MPRTSRKLPTEWVKYSPFGDVITGTRLFAFKTPLSLPLQQRVPKSHRFSTADLYWKMAEAGRCMGLVVNVTNTRRYYDRADIEGMMVGYRELPCSGKGFLGRKDLVKSFIRAVDEFLTENSGNDLLIGVHCSNGVNRAGYLICRYLVDRLGWSSHQAIDAFETARGYAFERGSYVQAIHNADRERRLKQQQRQTTSSQQGGGSGSSELNVDGEQRSEESAKAEMEGAEVLLGSSAEDRNDAKKKRRKRKKPSTDPLADIMPGFDPAFAAQMMQQFFALERQMKETAAKAVAATQSSLPVVAPCVPPPVKFGRSSATASPLIGGGDSSSLPMAYSSPNPTTTAAPSSLTQPNKTATARMSGVGPFTGMSLKTKTLAQTANFAFTTQKLKDAPRSGTAATFTKAQQPAYTPRAPPAKDPLQAAKAAAQSVSIAMELKGAEQISDDDEEQEDEEDGANDGEELSGGEDEDGSGEGVEGREIVGALTVNPRLQPCAPNATSPSGLRLNGQDRHAGTQCFSAATHAKEEAGEAVPSDEAGQVLGDQPNEEGDGEMRGQQLRPITYQQDKKAHHALSFSQSHRCPEWPSADTGSPTDSLLV